MSSSKTAGQQQDDNNNNKSGVDGPHNNDLVIRDGFPALHLPHGQPGPNIDGVEPLPRHSVWADAHALEWKNDSDKKALELLRQDAEIVFTARTRDDDQAYSAGITYFWPCRLPPRCALEALVQSIFEFHTRDLDPSVYVPEESGAEWWTLVLDDDDDDVNGTSGDHDTEEEDAGKQKENDDDTSESSAAGDEVGLHFDADYGLEAQVPNLMLHPRLATVTYLTDNGSPTVIFDLKSPPPNDVDKTTLQGCVRRGWMSHPVTGKHLAFDGRLLHGAPSTFFPARKKKQQQQDGGSQTKETKPGKNDPRTESEPLAKRPKVSDDETTNNATVTNAKRITLLVNIWLNHCPLDAEPLEEETIHRLKSPFKLPKANGKTNGDDDNYSDSIQSAFTWNPSLNLTQQPCMPKVSLEASSDNPAGSEEVVIGGRLVTVHYGASMENFHRTAWYGDDNDDNNNHEEMLELELGPEVIVLQVGGAVVDENEDEVEEEA